MKSKRVKLKICLSPMDHIWEVVEVKNLVEPQPGDLLDNVEYRRLVQKKDVDVVVVKAKP